MIIGRILPLAVLILGSTVALAQSKASVGELGKPELTIQIASDKSVYKVGEPILITITLRNDGDDIVWMSKPRGVGIYPGEFYVDAIAPYGTLLPNKSPILALEGDRTTRSKANKLQDFLCDRVPLFPGEFWGVSRNIEDAFVSLK